MTQILDYTTKARAACLTSQPGGHRADRLELRRPGEDWQPAELAEHTEEPGRDVFKLAESTAPGFADLRCCSTTMGKCSPHRPTYLPEADLAPGLLTCLVLLGYLMRFRR